MRLLLIEDDEILSNLLMQSLTSHHYVVDTVADGKMGWEYAQSTSYDLILMDVGLPRLDGILLCQRLRSEGCSTPILLITAKDGTTDRIKGLDAGADDYLVKPLDLDELHARVRALGRRGTVSLTSVLEVEELRLDPIKCQVTYEEKSLGLTSKEYSLLELFMRNPSRVFSRGQLVEHLWTFDDPPLEESVKAHIKGLRQKLKKAGAVDWIENVYGLGYRLSPKVSPGLEAKVLDASAGSDTNLKPEPKLVEQQFNQVMDGLWQQYQGLMAQRLEALQQAVAAVQSGVLSEELRQSAEQAAHKLAGVLGMFDRDAGTLLAREIEQILGRDRSSSEQQRLPALVQELSRLLNLQPNQNSLINAARLLLIDPEPQLGWELQQLAQAEGIGWEQVATLEQAEIWLQSRSPDLVVLSVNAIAQGEASLVLVADLSARTPSVPVLVLTAKDKLVDRVTIARAGGRGFLVKPVTATQVWQTASQLLQRSRSLTVNVLVVDDDPMFLAALRPMLEPWGIRMTGLDDPTRFWDVLQSVAPDLLILDVEMPLSGIELCQAVRTEPRWQGLPILFLTAHRDRETIQQVFAAGADDYVTKPVVEQELLTRIMNRLERTRLLQNLSIKELLTGLVNQPQSSRDLNRLLQQATGTNEASLCLVVFTLTDLHQINIQYGHDTGNQVLQRWGRLFQANFQGAEVLSYWGSGEFVVGLPGLNKVEAGDRLSEVLTTLRQQVFTALNGSRFQVNFSFGLAEYPLDGQTLHALYQTALTFNGEKAPL